MAYFLKKSNLKKGLYLQIYESFYDASRGYAAHRSIKPIGYVDELICQGIQDPVAFYKAEVDRMNSQLRDEKQQDKVRKISDESPERMLGYFPLKNINDSLGVKKYLDLMQSVMGFKFSLYDVLSSLIYARSTSPCSKSRTFEQVLPKLFESSDFTLSQIYSALEYIGSEYEKIIEIYNHQINSFYKFDTSHSFFDCTNFYFEIDKEDDFRKKGPSKEHRPEPIVGLGLLLDANQIPISMKLYPGNQSEKPVIREVIDGLKKRNNITGKTIQVADKGLNCANNVLHALKAGDGYIFSKSVKGLPETEQVWVLLPNDYVDIRDSNGDLLYRIKECIDDFEYTWTDENGDSRTERIREKRVVTYNPQLAKKQLYEINKQIDKAARLTASKAKQAEFGDSSRYVSFVSTDKKGAKTGGKVKTVLNVSAIEKAKQLAGYNLLVTSELKMPASEVYSAYHNLWRIEESFRIMKSQLEARPVYLQKRDTITGHFLICYLSVLLTRIFQFKVLNNRYCSETIFEFFKQFNVAKISDRKYINLARNCSFINELAALSGLPLNSYFLNNTQIRNILEHRFS